MTSIQDCLNPIAVKELRQAVKGRTIIWALILFLLIQLTIIGAVLVLSEDIQENFSVGRGLFSGLLGVLMGVCMLLLPAYAGFRISAERSESNVDLFFITTLKPTSIIWGKSVATIIITILFFSASFPFMTLTYLLRGLDVPSMLILLALDFLVVIASVHFGIFLGCLPGGLMSRIVRGLMGLGMLIGFLQTTLIFSIGMLFSGIGSTIGTWRFWASALTTAILLMLGIGMLFIMAVTVITPKSANRALGMRIYLIIIWIVSGLIAGFWAFSISDDAPVLTWMVGTVLVFCVNLCVSISERLEWGPRIIRRIPRNPLLRPAAFVLYSGASGGIVYSVLFIALTILATLAFIESGLPKWSHTDTVHGYMIATCVGLYAFCYTLTALTVRRIFFRNSARPDITSIALALLIIAGTAFPIITGFLIRTNTWERLSPMWYIGSPFVIVWWKDMWSECLTFSGIWAIVVGAFTVPWLVRQYRLFVPSQMKTSEQNNDRQSSSVPS